MPSFSTTVDHNLGKAEAKERLNSLLDNVRQKYGDQIGGLEQSWTADDTLSYVLTTYGFRISGTLVVHEDRVDLAGDLPFAAMMFKGKIESSIRAELEKALRDKS